MIHYETPGRGRPKQPLGLTEKQKQLVTLSIQGYKHKDISALMNMGQTTINSHFRHLLERWNVRTREALAAKAVKLGIIDLSQIEILTR